MVARRLSLGVAQVPVVLVAITTTLTTGRSQDRGPDAVKAQVDALIAAVIDRRSDAGERRAAVERLAAFGSSAGVRLIEEWLAEEADLRNDAEDFVRRVLLDMGPAAEPAVDRLVAVVASAGPAAERQTARLDETPRAALRLLADIGTCPGLSAKLSD